MGKELEQLVSRAKKRPLSAQEKEQQRRSFAYGNTHFENEEISRETVDAAAESLKLSQENEKD